MPLSVMSAPNSGGVCSRAVLTAETIWFSGSVSDSRISLDDTVKLRGTPSDRLRPLPSISRISEPGKRSEENTSELQSLMRISYAVFCLKKKIHNLNPHENNSQY